MRINRKVMLAALCLVGSSAFGQVFPPPAAQPPPGPDVKPPPPPPRPEPVQVHRAAPPPSTPQVPDVAYVPMVQRDADGRVIELEGNLDLLALRHNPLVRDDTIDALGPHVLNWRNRLDRMVIDYADIVLDLENGYFSQLDFSDDGQVYAANQLMMAMVAGGNLTKYLEEHGALSKEQAAFNQKIVQEYRMALYREKADEIAQRHGARSQEALIEVTRVTFMQLCADALWSLRRQLTDVAQRVGVVLPAAGMSEDETRRWQETIAAADDPFQAVKELFGSLEYEQQAAVLRAAMATSDASIPELEAARNKPEGTGTPPDDGGS